MPTKPLDSILDRNFAIVAAQPIIERASPLLEEMVGFSTNLLARASISPKGGQDEDLASLSLFHTAVGLLDGLQVLVSNAAAYAALPALRSLFEISMQLEYLLSDASLHRQRALSWLVFHIHETLHPSFLLDPSTSAGAEFNRVKALDDVAANIQFPTADFVEEVIREYEEFLKEPHLKDIESEYQSRGFRFWFQMFGGPPNIRELAIHLRMGAFYEVEYRTLSRDVHGIRRLAFKAGSDGEAVFTGLQGDLNDLRSVAHRAATYFIRNIRLIASYYRPGEDLRPWYLREIRDSFLWLGSSDPRFPQVNSTE